MTLRCAKTSDIGDECASAEVWALPPFIIPTSIWAARRNEFEFQTILQGEDDIWCALLDELPLGDNGWEPSKAELKHIKRFRWRLSRGPSDNLRECG